jgi:hypothetical protein
MNALGQYERKVLTIESVEDRISPEPNSGCWLWVGAFNGSGYGIVDRYDIGQRERAHRFVWRARFGSIPRGTCVLHRCDVRACVNPGHLFLGSRLDNVRDMCRKGRDRRAPSRGEDNGCSKLRAVDVLEIRASALTSAALGRRYGVTPENIQHIRARRSWRHV